MEPQFFKESDSNEAKMYAVGASVFDPISADLDDFLENGFDSAPFLLMLYDEGRAPYYARIPRAAFVAFIKEALSRFPVIGSFESYIFILKAVFGENSESRFEVTTPGKLLITVDATPNSEYEFIGREFVDGAYTEFTMTDYVDDTIIFRGFSGIATVEELELLFSEIVPTGITPEITLNFGVISDWVDETDSDISDEDDEGIMFLEGEA